jgi:hypothetical protein
VYCTGGDLKGFKGDNFNHLKIKMLPPLEQTATALIGDFKTRGM